MQLNYCAALKREARNMPKNVACAYGHFKQVIVFLKKYTNMILPDAMKLTDFSAQEHGRGKSTTIN
jgi:hypothetical protein